MSRKITIVLQGEQGVGKSYLAEALAVTLLNIAGITATSATEMLYGQSDLGDLINQGFFKDLELAIETEQKDQEAPCPTKPNPL